MGFLDRLFGRDRQQDAGQGYQQQGYQQQGYQQGYGQPAGRHGDGRSYGGVQGPSPRQDADDQAIRRYQYLLATAPPDQIERAHEEAFAKLTPEQRRELLTRLAQGDPADRPADDSPASLARSATRTEMREPGSLSRMFGRGGMGMGGVRMGMGGMLLGTMAGAFIGTAIANEFFDHDGFMDWDTSHPGESAFTEDASADAAQGGDGFAGDGLAADSGFDGGGFDGGGFDF